MDRDEKEFVTKNLKYASKREGGEVQCKTCISKNEKLLFFNSKNIEIIVVCKYFYCWKFPTRYSSNVNM